MNHYNLQDIKTRIGILEQRMKMTEDEIKEQKDIASGDIRDYLANLQYNLQEDIKLVKDGRCKIDYLDNLQSNL